MRAGEEGVRREREQGRGEREEGIHKIYKGRGGGEGE